MFMAQAINYLEAYEMGIGLPVHFGNISLLFKQVKRHTEILSPDNIAKYGSKIRPNREVEVRQTGKFVYLCKQVVKNE